MNVQQALFLGKKELKQCGIESCALDAELLLMKATAFTKVQLYTKNDVELTQKQQKQYLYDIEQRKQYKPIQYITGICEFMGLPFVVNEGVLIPRPDTEILVETVLQYHKQYHFKKVVDVCTGTGCIAVSLAKYSDMSLCGIDISNTAIQTAQKNAKNNAVCVQWYLSDLFENVPEQFLDNIEAVVCNPPYIATSEIQTLMPSVRNFEPHLALNGGEDGYYFYKKIVKHLQKHMKKNAFVFFEIGCEQSKQVCELLQRYGFDHIAVRKDLAGLYRVVLGQKVY